MEHHDVIIVGGGIAGVSAAYELGRAGASVALLEQESQPGYHATGRSAAHFVQTYGNPIVQSLTTRSDVFFKAPPSGFCDVGLVADDGALFVASEERAHVLSELRSASFRPEAVVIIDRYEALELVPVLRPSQAAAALYEPGAGSIDVHALMQGYVRGIRRSGGRLSKGARVCAIGRRSGRWVIDAAGTALTAPILVNAAGAWADNVARLAGARPLGLKPMRRTMATLPIPLQGGVPRWPLAMDVDETCYFKPDAGRLLVSPADESPAEAGDCYPDEMDVAIAIDRLERLTTIEVARLDASWAGLRTFALDRTPVVGFDETVEGFFWLAGQGGYGIQTAPTLATLTAQLVQDLPAALPAETVESLSPARFSG